MDRMTASAPIPQGPGATAPFPAPPAEGGGARLGWGLGIAGAVLVLCCGGGLAAFIGLVVTQVAATNEQSRAVVTDYLDALREEDYDSAYDLLCDEWQERATKDQFETSERARKKIDSYEIGEYDVYDDSVPVDERYRDGTTDKVKYFLRPDRKTARLEICGRN
jgi:hypothetical protein